MFSYKTEKKKVYAASSNITDNQFCIDRLFSLGIAGVVTKTISTLSDNRNGKEGKIWRNDKILYNSTRFSQRGLYSWVEILKEYYNVNRIIIPSVYSSERKELREMFTILQQINAPAIEVGISCPNSISKNQYEIMEDIAYALTHARVPVYVKLCSLDLDYDLLREYYDLGIKGFVLSDSFPQNVGEFTIGMSGDVIRECVLNSILQAREKGILAEIVGTGGIFTAEHIEQYFKAGADAVGLCSCMYIYGINSVENLTNY